MNVITALTHILLPHYPETEARALARWIVEERTGLTLTDVYMGKDSEIQAEELDTLQDIARRVAEGVPVQYAVGHCLFAGHRFNVAPGCLIPRPETEELVAWVSDSLRPSPPPSRVLDIGTGSGCIAISLALHGAAVTAFDISPEALAIARGNASELQATVAFEQQDILLPEEDKRQWDIIVSNPPYVRQLEAEDMENNVLLHEPHLALFVPDDDPLRFYRAIGQYALSHLSPGGWLFFEINQYLAHETAELLRTQGFNHITTRNDQFGHSRMIRCQHP